MKKSVTRYIVRNTNKVYIIDVSIDKSINSIELTGADLKWVDTKISP